MSDLHRTVLVIGTGPMSIEYVKVLRELGFGVEVKARSESSASAYENQHRVRVHSEWDTVNLSRISETIVAVPEESLTSETLNLIERGATKILVEKPGGLEFADISRVSSAASLKNSEVYVAYNRRHTSVSQIVKRLVNTSDLQSFEFEFSERTHIIEQLSKPSQVLGNWFFQNSSHVIDLAFFIGGEPKQVIGKTNGGNNWHPSGTKFTGFGMTANNVPFSCFSDWDAPGAWTLTIGLWGFSQYMDNLENARIEVPGSLTRALSVQKSSLDRNFKPGLFRQVRSFLSTHPLEIPTIEEQLRRVGLYEQILRGS